MNCLNENLALPLGWKETLLDAVVERSSGHTPDKNISEYWNGNIPWISLKDTKRLDMLYIEETEDYTTEKGIAHSSAVLLPEGTVVISRDATIGKVGIMNRPMATSQHFINYVCSKELDKHYLYYYLMGQRKRFEKVANGSTIKTIGLKYFEKLKIILPPIEEQRKVACVLLVWDRTIEIKEKLLEQRRLQKKCLMERLLTGKARLPNFQDKWLELPLGILLKERKEIGYSGLELLSITAQNGVVKRAEIDKVDTSSEDKSKYKRICPMDIGYNTMRMWQGVSGFSKYEGIVSPAYTVLKPTEKVDTYFMAYLFKLPKTINLFWRHSQGLVDDTLSIKYDSLKKIRVRIPSEIEEQTAIAEVLRSADGGLDILQNEITQLKLQKKGLMQLLLTGKVRVPC